MTIDIYSIDESLDTYIDGLNKDIKKLQKFKKEQHYKWEYISLNVEKIQEKKYWTELEEMKKLYKNTKPYIYIFSANKNDVRRIRDLFPLKGDILRNERSFSLNDEKRRDSKTLYVGSSRNIYKRILEHLGYGSEKTYSLHLNALKWKEKDRNIIITISYCQVSSEEILQHLEDAIWDKYEPVFGRRGQR